MAATSRMKIPISFVESPAQRASVAYSNSVLSDVGSCHPSCHGGSSSSALMSSLSSPAANTHALGVLVACPWASHLSLSSVAFSSEVLSSLSCCVTSSATACASLLLSLRIAGARVRSLFPSLSCGCCALAALWCDPTWPLLEDVWCKCSRLSSCTTLSIMTCAICVLGAPLHLVQSIRPLCSPILSATALPRLSR